MSWYRAWRLMVLFTLALTFGAARPVAAQSEGAEVTGTVTDPSGAAVAGATVQVIQTSTNLTTTITTDAAGLYYARENVGIYQIRVQAPSFVVSVISNVQLTAGHTTRQDITLGLGSTTQAINVTAEAAAARLDRENSSVSMILPTQMVQSLPVFTRRVYEMLVTVPGVSFQNGVNNRGFVASIFQPFVSIGGSPSGRGNIFIMDGVNIKNTRLTGDTGGLPAFNPPPEDVEEFRVLLNNYSAEFGDSAGGAGAIDIATKQGASGYHGQLFEYIQNNAFDTRNFFAAKRLPNHYNNFGGTFGGPIRKNKTFFFVNLMWMRQYQSTQEIDTVPSMAQRNGDFSQTFNSQGNLIPIYDPLTTCGMYQNPACATDVTGKPIETRQQFPGNIIPTGRLDPVALNILQHYPTPTGAGTITGGNNFSALSHSLANANDVQYYRVDHQFNEKNHFNAMWANDYLLLTPCGGWCGQPASAVADITASRYWISGSLFIAGLTTVLRPTVVNDFRFGFVGNSFHSKALYNVPGVWQQDWAEKLGLQNVDGTTFPWVNAAGFTNMGGQARGQQEYYAGIWHNWIFQDHMNWIHSNHNTRFGTEVKPSRETNASRLTPSGALTFDTLGTALPGVSGTGNSIASMLNGFVAGSTHLDQLPLDRHTWYLGLFVQDDWHIRKNLTLNLGVRWEFDRPTYDATGGFSSFSPVGINPVCDCPGVIQFARIMQGQNHGKEVKFYAAQYTHFQPRVGLAWSPGHHDRWVVRAGAGLFDPGQDQGTSMWNAPNLGNQIEAQTLIEDGLGLNSPFVLSQGFPAYNQPALTDGFGAVPIGQSPTLAFSEIPFKGPVQKMIMTNFNVQRQIGESFKVEIGYLGNNVRNMAIQPQINEVAPNLRGPGFTQVLRAFPQYGNITQLATFLGFSNYNAGYVAVSKSFSHGVTFESNFTDSKMLATSAGGNPYQGWYLFQAHPRGSYGPTGFDTEKRFVWSGSYDLPVGPGKSLLRSGVPSKILGGWRVAGVFAWYSGFPLSVTPLANTENCFCPQGAVRLSPVTYTSNFDDPRKNTWFNTGSFGPAAPYTFGNTGVGIIRGPRFNNVDASLTKVFSLTERYAIDFRADAFDLFNHPNWGLPNTSLGNPSFGYITATAAPGGNRTMQLSAKFLF